MRRNRWIPLGVLASTGLVACLGSSPSPNGIAVLPDAAAPGADAATQADASNLCVHGGTLVVCVDAGHDSGVDASKPGDGGVDAYGPDASVDAETDSGADAETDTGAADAAADSTSDTGADSAEDAGGDVRDAAADAGSDAESDAAPACSIVAVFGDHYITSTGHVYATYPTVQAIHVATADGGQGPLLSGIVQGADNALTSACGLQDGGTVWCWWGYEGKSGDLGDLGPGSKALEPAGGFLAVQVVMPLPADGGFTPLVGVRALMNDSFNSYDRPTCAIVDGDGGANGIDAIGEVFCWGNDYPQEYAEIGNTAGPIYNDVYEVGVPYALPVALNADGGPLTNVDELTVGYDHACVITSSTPGARDGLRCWGNEISGQVGDLTPGSTADTANNYPTEVVRLPDARYEHVSASEFTTCTIASFDGGTANAYCWGSSFYGQTGTGIVTEGGDKCPNGDFSCETSDPSRPVVLGPSDGGTIAYDAATPLANVETIVGGEFFACATNVDGVLYCWGGYSGSPAVPYANPLLTAAGDASVTPAMYTVTPNAQSYPAGVTYVDQAGSYWIGTTKTTVTCE